MDYFGIKAIDAGVTATDNYKAFYASTNSSIVFTSKAGDETATVAVPAGSILPVFSRATYPASTGTFFGLY